MVIIDKQLAIHTSLDGAADEEDPNPWNELVKATFAVVFSFMF